jgi:hypothetical protein
LSGKELFNNSPMKATGIQNLMTAALACGLTFAATTLFAQGASKGEKSQAAAQAKTLLDRVAPQARLPVHDSRKFRIGPAHAKGPTTIAHHGIGPRSVNKAASYPPGQVRRRLAGGALSVFPAAGQTGIGQSFEGIDFNGSSCGCLPPDTGAAVGNNFVVETVNAQVRIFDKTTGSILLDKSLESWLGGPARGAPHGGFDRGGARW